MKIGYVNLKGNMILAPLAGYTDRAFRQIATLWGADCCVTEMVSAEGLSRDGEKTKELLYRFDGEDDLIIQIFGSNEDQIERCLPNLLKFNPSIIDINCGCPVPKVVKTGAGSALMERPETAALMIKTIKKNTDIPVSVKFRLGWNNDKINYLAFATACVDAGADMLTMHGRTRVQGYQGKSNTEEIRKLKKAFPTIPVFASGDVISPEAALRILEETGADGLMFARGAIGNPFIFSQTKSLIANSKYDEIPLKTKVDTMINHLKLMVEYLGEKKAVVEIRKHISGYVKGVENAGIIKNKCMQAKNADEYFLAFSELLDK